MIWNVSHMAAHDYQSARALLRRWSEADVGAVQPLALLARRPASIRTVEPARAAEPHSADTPAERTGVRPPEPGKPDESDPIRRLEQRLASARDAAEKDWLNLMLGIAQFQAQHWKEASTCLEKVLEKDPDNLSAREMMNKIRSMEKPK